MKKRPSHEDITEAIDTIREINREVGFGTLLARENAVREALNRLANDLSTQSWALRPAVLSARSSSEVAAELEALFCVS